MGFKLKTAITPVTLLTAALLAVVMFSVQPCGFGDSISNVQYVRNYDGDTITVNISGLPAVFGKEVNVRVNRIDTPELRSKVKCEKDVAMAAKQLVHDLCGKAKKIELKNIDRGKYFRLVADVICDGKSVSKTLLAKGWAVPYDGGTKSPFKCRS